MARIKSAGFRALDTAERYRTEKEVGEALSNPEDVQDPRDSNGNVTPSPRESTKPRPSAARMGGPTRDGPPYYIQNPQPHPGEL
jgi:hypothetical protein